MSLLFELRAAARQATEITIEYGGGDPVELVRNVSTTLRQALAYFRLVGSAFC